MEEDFIFRSSKGSNENVRISDLWLLPQKNDTLHDFSSQDRNALGLLSDNLILFEENDKYFVQVYNFGGLQGQAFEIEIGQLKRSLKRGNFKSILGFGFWEKDQEIILIRYENKWQIIDLQTYPFDIQNIARLSQTQLLTLDKSGQLWMVDIETGEYGFLTSGITELTFTDTPDNIWIWKDDGIYRLDRGFIEPNQFELDSKLYTSNKLIKEKIKDIDPNRDTIFLVKSIFQGNLIKIAGMIVYIPDFEPDRFNIIAEEVVSLGTDANSVFWLDKEQNLFAYNFFSKHDDYFGKLDLVGDPDYWQINYFSGWNRLMIYSSTQVYSIWYDKDILNKSIHRYPVNLWIEDAECLGKVIDRFQFCIKDNKIITYKHTLPI